MNSGLFDSKACSLVLAPVEGGQHAGAGVCGWGVGGRGDNMDRMAGCRWPMRRSLVEQLRPSMPGCQSGQCVCRGHGQVGDCGPCNTSLGLVPVSRKAGQEMPLGVVGTGSLPPPAAVKGRAPAEWAEPQAEGPCPTLPQSLTLLSPQRTWRAGALVQPSLSQASRRSHPAQARLLSGFLPFLALCRT